MPSDGYSKAESLSRLLDRSIRLPGGFRIGVDGIVGLIPGVGDTATGLISLWLLLEAHREGLPKSALMRMGGNIFLDTTLGAIPVVGDVFDFVWKSNMRNLRILEKHREKLASGGPGGKDDDGHAQQGQAGPNNIPGTGTNTIDGP